MKHSKELLILINERSSLPVVTGTRHVEGRFWVAITREDYSADLQRHVHIYGPGTVRALKALEDHGLIVNVPIGNDGLHHHAYCITEDGRIKAEEMISNGLNL